MVMGSWICALHRVDDTLVPEARCHIAGVNINRFAGSEGLASLAKK